MFLQCMENCHAKLDVWNKNVFSQMGKNISRLRKSI